LKTHSLLRFRSRPAAGPSDAFRDLVLAHLDGAYSLACYLTRDPVLSEDIVQDAVVRAFRAFDQYRGGSSRAWLLAIVRNCCRTAQTSRGGALGLVVQEIGGDEKERADPSPTPEEEAIRNGEVDRVRAAIEAMPEPFREAVVLRDLEELSYAEIAEVTGVPVGTVMSRLSRGRAMLATALLPPGRDRDDATRSAG
jgi:RNA polymerase sigma factor (sigma-70 family)